MLGRNRLTVADPVADHVHGVLLGQLRLSGGPEVLEQLGPGGQAGLADDPLQLRPQVGVGVSIPGDDVLGPRLGLFPDFFQVWA